MKRYMCEKSFSVIGKENGKLTKKYIKELSVWKIKKELDNEITLENTQDLNDKCLIITKKEFKRLFKEVPGENLCLECIHFKGDELYKLGYCIKNQIKAYALSDINSSSNCIEKIYTNKEVLKDKQKSTNVIKFTYLLIFDNSLKVILESPKGNLTDNEINNYSKEEFDIYPIQIIDITELKKMTYSK